MARALFSLALLLLILSGCSGTGGSARNAPAEYEPTWVSLARYDEAPAWFRDAKFGIYLHWGVLSVPAFAHDWYPRAMHLEGGREYEHQVAMYGPLSAFGYHDFVPMFRAERYDPEAWADLFQASGARFAGMVAEHHDGFSMWNSDVNPWNAADMGPHRDVLGDFERAVHGRGMPFVATFHMARNLQIYADRPVEAQTDSSYFPYLPGTATASADPLLRMLYGNVPPDTFFRNWLAKLEEVVDAYHPDLIYFDGLLGKIPEDYRKAFLAHYLNQSAERGKPVVVTHKNGELPEEVSLPDYEKGRTDRITERPWLTDETISTGSWSYTEGLELKSAADILHVLIDAVSKNGTLMLNVSPRADGVIPDDQQLVLRAIGAWLAQNGEAIYGTRPWYTFGEGPTRQETAGHFLPHIDYTAADYRYTTRGDTVYAVALGRPAPGTNVLLTAFAPAYMPEGTVIRGAEHVASGLPVRWSQDAAGLILAMPDTEPDAPAVAFRILTVRR